MFMPAEKWVNSQVPDLPIGVWNKLTALKMLLTVFCILSNQDGLLVLVVSDQVGSDRIKTIVHQQCVRTAPLDPTNNQCT